MCTPEVTLVGLTLLGGSISVPNGNRHDALLSLYIDHTLVGVLHRRTDLGQLRHIEVVREHVQRPVIHADRTILMTYCHSPCIAVSVGHWYPQSLKPNPYLRFASLIIIQLYTHTSILDDNWRIYYIETHH